MVRSCGGCTLCCKIPRITPLNKPPNVLCHHAEYKVGCGIYEQRPQACKDFKCLWLKGGLHEEWYPGDMHLYVTGSLDDEMLIVRVDPHRPDAWKQEGGARVIKHLKKRYHLLIAVRNQVTFICGDNKPAPDKVVLDWLL